LLLRVALRNLMTQRKYGKKTDVSEIFWDESKDKYPKL
jgi:hypothetical protein